MRMEDWKWIMSPEPEWHKIKEERLMQDYQIIPLIASASPRDIPEFLDATFTLMDDKCFAKYLEEHMAYKLIRKFFMEYKRYTHLVIIPDDLVVTRQQYEHLRNIVEQNRDKYPVLAGTCHPNFHKHDKLITCKTIPNPDEADYPWMSTEDADYYCRTGQSIQQVEFDGFACSFIRRDVIEQIEIEGHYKQFAYDFAFAKDCKEKGIPIHVDLSTRFTHLGGRKGHMKFENWGVGFKEPRFIVEVTRGPASRRDKGFDNLVKDFAPLVNNT